MSVKIIRKSTKFNVYSNYDKKLLDLVKAYPESRWDSKNREWTIPNRFYDNFMIKLQSCYFRHEFDFEEKEESKHTVNTALTTKSKILPPVIITIIFNDCVQVSLVDKTDCPQIRKLAKKNGIFDDGKIIIINNKDLRELLLLLDKSNRKYEFDNNSNDVEKRLSNPTANIAENLNIDKSAKIICNDDECGFRASKYEPFCEALTALRTLPCNFYKPLPNIISAIATEDKLFAKSEMSEIINANSAISNAIQRGKAAVLRHIESTKDSLKNKTEELMKID